MEAAFPVSLPLQCVENCTSSTLSLRADNAVLFVQYYTCIEASVGEGKIFFPAILFHVEILASMEQCTQCSWPLQNETSLLIFLMLVYELK